jgi:hypothetical protein
MSDTLHQLVVEDGLIQGSPKLHKSHKPKHIGHWAEQFLAAFIDVFPSG